MPRVTVVKLEMSFLRKNVIRSMMSWSRLKTRNWNCDKSSKLSGTNRRAEWHYLRHTCSSEFLRKGRKLFHRYQTHNIQLIMIDQPVILDFPAQEPARLHVLSTCQSASQAPVPIGMISCYTCCLSGSIIRSELAPTGVTMLFQGFGHQRFARRLNPRSETCYPTYWL